MYRTVQGPETTDVILAPDDYLPEPGTPESNWRLIVGPQSEPVADVSPPVLLPNGSLVFTFSTPTDGVHPAAIYFKGELFTTLTVVIV